MESAIDENVEINWLDLAACKGMDPSMFFVDTRRAKNQPETRYAISVCNSCSVSEQCLQENLHEQFGIWGGTTAEERQKIRVKKGSRLNCSICDKRFTSSNMSTKYCSDDCRRESRRIQNRNYEKLKRVQTK